MLIQVLSRLTAAGTDVEAFAREARDLTPGARREAAVIHLGALLESLPATPSGDSYRFGAITLELAEADEGVIAYNDIGVAFEVSGARIVENDGPSTMAGLLELLSYAQAGSDALFYLPSALRDERIAALVARTGASERFVRYVLGRAPAIERSLAS